VPIWSIEKVYAVVPVEDSESNVQEQARSQRLNAPVGDRSHLDPPLLRVGCASSSWSVAVTPAVFAAGCRRWCLNNRFEESDAETGTRRSVCSTQGTGHLRRPVAISCPSGHGRLQARPPVRRHDV